MPERKRNESGQFTESVTLDDVLDVFDEVRGPVVGTADVASKFDVSTELARRKLRRLHDQGHVESRKIGRTTVFWRDDGGSENGSTSAETHTQRSGKSGLAGSHLPADGDVDGRPEIPSDLETWIDDWTPDREVDTKVAREEIRRTVGWFQQTDDWFTRQDFVDELARMSSLGDRSWWERAVQPALSALDDETEFVEQSGSRYRWTGD